MKTKDQILLEDAYTQISTNSPDSHLLRVYQAVRKGEWSFEDFKDFVSVVRNEAKIAASTV